MKEKAFSRLNLEEFQRICQMRVKLVSFQKIADALGRAKSTVRDAWVSCCEYPLRTRYTHHLELGRWGWEQARKYRSRPRSRLRLKSQEIRIYVEEKLKDGWSPEIIAGRIKLEKGLSISYEAIYEWIEHEVKHLKTYLLRAGKTRRGKPGARGRKKREAAAPKKSIEQRPEAANARSEVGHAESDLILSCRGGRSCLLTFVDRKMRLVRLVKVANREAETVKTALFAILRELPKECRRTLTQDNGSEHALHAQLEALVEGLQVYFCHPYSASERGTVENRNGFLRRHFPKGTNFDLVTDEQVKWVERLINSRPMKVLGFRTPDEVFAEEMKLAA